MNDMFQGIMFSEGGAYHHHENHKHAKAEDLDDDDVKHQDHLDDSLFDYVICLLSELEHPANEGHQCYIQPKLNELTFSGFSKAKLLTVLFSAFADVPSYALPVYFNTSVAFSYQDPLTINSPLRGPPSIS